MNELKSTLIAHLDGIIFSFYKCVFEVQRHLFACVTTNGNQ